MCELKRIFSDRRLTAFILLLVFLNALLFYQAQNAANYGLDLTLPSCSVSFDLENNSELSQPAIDAKKACRAYRNALDRYGKMPAETARQESEQERNRLGAVLEAAALIQQGSAAVSEEKLRELRSRQPELTAQLESGKIDLDEIRLSYVAVNNVFQKLSYLTGYDDFLAAIRENKASLLQFPIFNAKDGFTIRNIVKTASEFEKLNGVPLSLISDGAVSSFLDFSLTDFLFPAVLAAVCVSFSEERKKGLWNVVHAAYKGRTRLALNRAGILFCVSAVSVLLLYGTNLLLGLSVYGGWGNFGAAIQSAEVLHNLPVLGSVGNFIVQYLFWRVLSGFFIGLLFWLLLTAFHNVKSAILISAGLFAVEYGFYRFLPVQSGWNVLKYFNIFTYIRLSDLYVNYLNINLFSYPLGIRRLSLSALLPLILFTGCSCIILSCRKKPAAGNDLFGKASYKLHSLTDSVLRRLPVLGIELYKILFIQKGFPVLLLFLCIVSGLSFTARVPVNNAADAAARAYTAALSGEITENTFRQIDRIQAELDSAVDLYEQAKTKYEAGEMEFSEYDVFARKAEAAQIRSDGLSEVRDRATELKNQAVKKNFSPYLIEDSAYQGTYGEPSNLNRRNAAVLAMLTVVLLVSGCFAYETQSGMNALLAAAKYGRKALLRRKVAAAAILTAVIRGTLSGFELCAFLRISDTETFSASVQNLSFLARFPIRCSIGVFLVGLYVLRYLMLFGVALLSLLISSCAKRTEQAHLASCGILILPSVLYLYLGLTPMKYPALALPVDGMSLLLSGQGAAATLFSAVLALAVFTIIAISALSEKMKASGKRPRASLERQKTENK